MGLLIRTIRRAAITAAACAAFAPTAQAEGASRPSSTLLAKSLEVRCLERMEELSAQAKRNEAAIAWEISPVAVRGTFSGYSPNHTCTLGAPDADPPTATLRYEEVLFEKSGKTLGAAEKDEARPLEITEVTEVLLYQKGRWQ